MTRLSASGTRAVAYWSEFDASQKLSIGRFAAQNGVDHAICLGTLGRPNSSATSSLLVRLVPRKRAVPRLHLQGRRALDLREGAA